jgi:hypothetical protein
MQISCVFAAALIIVPKYAFDTEVVHHYSDNLRLHAKHLLKYAAIPPSELRDACAPVGCMQADHGNICLCSEIQAAKIRASVQDLSNTAKVAGEPPRLAPLQSSVSPTYIGRRQ